MIFPKILPFFPTKPSSSLIFKSHPGPSLQLPSSGAAVETCQEPVLFASSIRHNIMQGFPDASKEDFTQAGWISAGFGIMMHFPKMESFFGWFLRGKDTSRHHPHMALRAPTNQPATRPARMLNWASWITCQRSTTLSWVLVVVSCQAVRNNALPLHEPCLLDLWFYGFTTWRKFVIERCDSMVVILVFHFVSETVRRTKQWPN